MFDFLCRVLYKTCSHTGAERVVLHVDMDCFFASVAAVGRPELAGRPLAVCHSNSGKGTGEVSSANYVVGTRRGGGGGGGGGVWV